MNIRKEEFIAALLALGVAGAGAAGCGRDADTSVGASTTTRTTATTSTSGDEGPVVSRRLDADGNEVIVLNDDIRSIEIDQQQPEVCPVEQQPQAVLGDTDEEGPTDE